MELVDTTEISHAEIIATLGCTASSLRNVLAQERERQLEQKVTLRAGK